MTGGAGFLGSKLVQALLPMAKCVFVLDDLFTGTLAAIPESDKVVFVHGSVTDGALLRKLLAEVDYVFHFAARNIVLSAEQPESDFHTNVEGTVQLVLNALCFPNIRRIVYASTSSVYGNSSALPITEVGYDISVPYAASKMSAELLATAYCKLYGIPVTCLRFSNVYGPGQRSSNPYCGVVTKFMESIVEDQPMRIFGDGKQTRDFTYVEDAIRATLLAGVHAGTVGQVFNVGTGVESEISVLAEKVAEVAGHNEYPIVHCPKRVIDTVHRRAIDASKLTRATGWQPQVSVDVGLKKTWTWFSNSSVR